MALRVAFDVTVVIIIIDAARAAWWGRRGNFITVFWHVEQLSHVAAGAVLDEGRGGDESTPQVRRECLWSRIIVCAEDLPVGCQEERIQVIGRIT